MTLTLTVIGIFFILTACISLIIVKEKRWIPVGILAIALLLGITSLAVGALFENYGIDQEYANLFLANATVLCGIKFFEFSLDDVSIEERYKRLGPWILPIQIGINVLAVLNLAAWAVLFLVKAI